MISSFLKTGQIPVIFQTSGNIVVLSDMLKMVAKRLTNTDAQSLRRKLGTLSSPEVKEFFNFFEHKLTSLTDISKRQIGKVAEKPFEAEPPYKIIRKCVN